MSSISPSVIPLPHASAFAASTRFVASHLLGVGATGSVYKAWDRLRGEHVAVKVLHRADAAAKARLERQIHALSCVQHPSLVRTHGLAELGDKLAIVMALAEGQDFMRYVRAGEPAPGYDEARLVSCVAQLVGALSSLHEAYFVHRDVKPSNLRVTASGRLVLLDLGTAAELSDLEEPGVGVGTPAYMAPEQATGEPIARAADFYALGVVLYEVLTGALPYPELAKRHFDNSPDHGHRLKSLVPSAPEPLAQLAASLLTREPSARPTAREVLARLDLPMSSAAAILPVSIKGPSRLLARSVERAALRSAFEQAQSRGNWMHVSAARGAGKTQLLRDLAAHVKKTVPTAQVLRRSFRAERDSSYGSLDALAELLSERLLGVPALPDEALIHAPWLTKMWPAMLRVPWLGGPRRTSQWVDPLLGRLAAERLLAVLVRHVAAHEPLLLIFEDLEAASVDALAVLGTLLAEARAPSVCWITCASAQAALDVSAASRLELAPCDDDLRRELVAHMWSQAVCEGPAPMELASAHDSPRACIELVRARILGHPATTAREALTRRILDLPEATRHVLGLLCAAITPMGRETLGVASVLEGVHIRTHLARLLDLALITRTADVHGAAVFAPESEDVVEALQALLGSEALKSLHFDWGLLLASHRGACPAHAFEHLRLAGQDALAMEQARLAADDASKRLAFGMAAEQLVAVDELLQRSSAPRATPTHHLRALADALALAGHPLEAAQACARALAGAPPAESLQLASRRTELLMRAGCLEEGLASARAVLAAADLSIPSTPQRALASLVWHRTLLGLRGFGFDEKKERQISPRALTQVDALLDTSSMVTAVDPIVGTELLARGLRRAFAVREPRRVARALLRESASQAHLEKPPFKRARAVLERARTMIEALDDATLREELAECESFVAFQSFHLRGAATSYEAVIERQRFRNVRDAEVAGTRHAWMQSLLLLGDFSKLVTAYGEARREAQRRGDAHSVVTYSALLGAVVALINDTPRDALRDLEDADARFPQTGLYIRHAYEIFGRGSLLLYQGDVAAVAGVLARIERMRSAMFARVGLLRAMFDLTEVGLRLRRAAATPSACEEDLREAQRLVPRHCAYPLIAAEWLRIRASLCLWERDRAGALEALRGYVTQRRALGCATAAGEYGVGILEGGEAGQAGCERACAELTAQGVKSVPRFVRAFCAVSGPEDLGL